MKFTNIKPALEWINSLKASDPLNRFDKIYHALDLLDNPHTNLPVIHITGTNGKGSTTSYLKYLLQSQGLKVGAFTSPHIMKINERFYYNGSDISDEDLLWLINQMYEVDLELEKAGYEPLVFFELYTVMACLYFSKVKPDVCLFEVGIGGYSDYTNVVDGQVCLITTIGLDHGEFIKQTYQDIAYEKSGIIKHGSKVVIGPLPSQAQEVIEEKVTQEQAQLYIYDQDFSIESFPHKEPTGSDFTFYQKEATPLKAFEKDFTISMLGSHQAQNASLAIEAFLLWMDLIDQEIDWSSASSALKETRWIARMECMSKDPLIYIDGAHNSSGLQALIKMLGEYFSDYEITLIYAGLVTKHQSEQIPLLLEINPKRFVLTEFKHEKSMHKDKFITAMKDLGEDVVKEIEFISDWQGLIQDYIDQNKGGNQKTLLLVTGSLYFVSEIRQFLRK